MRKIWSSPEPSGSRLSRSGFESRHGRWPRLPDVAATSPKKVLAEELPWLSWLPADERATCVRELLADLVAGADTGLLTPFARNLASWRSTAEVWAYPRLARELQGPFDGDGPVIDLANEE